MNKHLRVIVICLVVVLLVATAAVAVACKKTITPTLNATDITETYDGQPHTVHCSTSEGDLGWTGTSNANWTVDYYDEKGDLVTEEAPIYVGTYTASITLHAAGYASVSTEATLKIEKAEPSVKVWPSLVINPYEISYGEQLDSSSRVLSITRVNDSSKVADVNGAPVSGTFGWAAVYQQKHYMSEGNMMIYSKC